MSFQDIEKRASQPLLDNKQDPSKAVAAGIFQITTYVSTFKRLVNTLGTPKDTSELREKLHKTRLLIVQLATETSAKLKIASETDHATDVNPGKKIADAKLAKDYQAVLQEFQKVQRTAAARETAYSPFPVLPSAYTASELKLSSENSQVQEHQALLVEQRRQEVLSLESEIVFNEALMEERDQGIREIQQQVGEVNEIFKDLAVLVHEQGVMIDDIDSHIEMSHGATTQANRQIMRAAKTQKSNSSLACSLLVIFGIVLLVLIIVLAT